MRIFDLMHKEMTLSQLGEKMDKLGYCIERIDLKKTSMVYTSKETEHAQIYFDIENNKIKVSCIVVEL